MHTSVHTSAGDQLAGDDNTSRMALFGHDEATCEGDLIGIIAYLDDQPIDQDGICGLVGQPLVVTLTVQDEATGNVDVLERRVVGAQDPEDPCPAP